MYGVKRQLNINYSLLSKCIEKFNEIKNVRKFVFSNQFNSQNKPYAFFKSYFNIELAKNVSVKIVPSHLSDHFY